MAVLWAVVGLMVGVGMTWLFELALKNWQPMRRKYIDQKFRLGGYHVHHSSYGLVAWLAALVCWLLGYVATGWILAGIGLGVVVQHTLSHPRRAIVFWDKS